MIDLQSYRYKLENLARKFNLGHLCGCQLTELAKEIRAIDEMKKEQFLALVYLESLLQGFVYTYDKVNYWSYLSLITDKQITICYHGGEIQFRLLLMIPEYDRSFDKDLLAKEVESLSETLLPRWLDLYSLHFGEPAEERLRSGVYNDSDVYRLIREFPFLKGPIETTFSKEESA